MTFYFALQCHRILLSLTLLGKDSNDEVMGIYSNYAFLFVLLSFFDFAPPWVKNQKKLIDLSSINANFFKKDLFVSYTPCVYMIVSFYTKHWYVGRTTRFFNFRIREHINQARKYYTFGTKKIYEVMSSVGFENFCFIPVFQGNEVEVNFIEKMLINRFRPTLNSELYSSKFKMLPSCMKHVRWSAKKRKKIKKQKGLNVQFLDFCKRNFTQPKMRTLRGFSVINNAGMTTDSSLSLEYILTKYNNERITLMFDYSCKYFNNFECILNKFRPSEVFKFSFWKNGKKYFYDGKYCGFEDELTEHSVLRNSTVLKPKGFLNLNCVFNL